MLPIFVRRCPYCNDQFIVDVKKHHKMVGPNSFEEELSVEIRGSGDSKPDKEVVDGNLVDVR